MHARRETPSELPQHAVAFGADADRPLTRVLVDVGLAVSTSEAGRKIQQGGVRLNGRVTDIKHRLRPGDLPRCSRSRGTRSGCVLGASPGRELIRANATPVASRDRA